MFTLASRLLRVVLIVLLLGSVLVQVLIPVAASQVGTAFPEVAYLVVPYSVAAIAAVACVQVALLVGWPLLSLVDRGLTFTPRTVRWLRVITVCASIATLLSTVVFVHVIGFVPGSGGPMSYYLAGCVAAGLACVLATIVVRGVLESGIECSASPGAVA